MKRLLIICIVFIIYFCFNLSSFAQNAGKISVIVIDAGHGGKDPGASGKSSREKDIALSVALKTGRYIEQNLPGVKVKYTRKTDKFIELHRRGQIANEAEADLFISIHCNSNPSKSPYGTETYALGVEEKRTKRNMEVAMTENAAIMLEENQGESYGGFNAKSSESYIGLTLFQSEHLSQSLDLANRIQEQFKNRVGRKDRGVHQAGFLVLWRTAMPSVLVELGYLSNSTEEAFLKSEKGQTYLASAIYRAVRDYKRAYEKEGGAYDYRKEALESLNDTKSAKDNITAPKESAAVNTTVEKITKSDLVYRIQFYTSPQKLKLNDKRFKSLPNIVVYQQNGLFKYTSGTFNSFKDAEKNKSSVKNAGFKDAFTVAFHKGMRVTIADAKKILNEK